MKLIGTYYYQGEIVFVFEYEGFQIDLIEKWIFNGWNNSNGFRVREIETQETISITPKTINQYIEIIRKEFPELLL